MSDDGIQVWASMEVVEGLLARAEEAEAAMQRVLELCDAREEEENDNGGYGKAALVLISDVRDILEVHE